MQSESIRSSFFNHVAQTSDAPLGIEITHAEGMHMYAADKSYIDCISGISVSNLGHANEQVIKAVEEQMKRHTHLMVYGELIQNSQSQLASELAEVLPDKLNSVYFVNSGSEAIEGAMKLAKRFTGRHHFVALKKAYHGSTHGALSLMSDKFFSDAFVPLLPGISFLEQNDCDSIDSTIGSDTAAVFVEPVMGEKGYEPCDLQFLRALRKRCDEVGALLVFDEIQTGYGRTGKLFAFEHDTVLPDILILAKGFGGGLPLGAFIASNEIMRVLQSQPVLGHITTFGGHPVSCAASLAVLRQLRQGDLLESIDRKEKLFRSLLVHPKILKVTGKGLMLSIVFEQEEFCKKVIDRCVESGLLIDWFLFAPDRIRLAPPLIIEERHIHDICGIILENISKVMQP